MALLSMIIRYPFPGSVVLLAYDLLSCSCFDLLVSSCPVIAGALFWDWELLAQLVYANFIVRIGALMGQSEVQSIKAPEQNKTERKTAYFKGNSGEIDAPPCISTPRVLRS